MQGAGINMEILQSVANWFAEDHETASGHVMENKFEAKMNEFEEEGGVGVKLQLLFDGPELAKELASAKTIFPDKTSNDILGFIAIRVKGDPQEAIDQLKELLEMNGITEEMTSPFVNIVYSPADNEIHIGISPANEEMLAMATPYLINPTWVKGDGSEELGIDLSINFATTLSEALDDEPVFTHFLKGGGAYAKARIHESSKDIFMKIINNNWGTIKPVVEKIPILAPLLLLKKIEGVLELECTQEMREEITELVQENAPPAAMSLKDMMSFAKQAGVVPIEMLEPGLNWVKDHFAGEVRIFVQRSIGFRVTMKLPGLDEVISEFIDA
jgi:hypothetical protein